MHTLAHEGTCSPLSFSFCPLARACVCVCVHAFALINRCNIPVIVMGETGCGKTRLVKFLCALQIPPRTVHAPQKKQETTMVLVKVL